MENKKITTFLFVLVVAIFIVGCGIAKDNWNLRNENNALKEKVNESRVVYVYITPNDIPNDVYQTNQKTLLVNMIDSMNTESNVELLSNLIKSSDVSTFNSIFKAKIPNINKSSAIAISIYGNHGVPLRGNNDRSYDLCFIVDLGVFPNCLDLNNTSEISMSYNDVDFAYKNQELIRSMGKDGNITAYELSKLVVQRMIYDINTEE